MNNYQDYDCFVILSALIPPPNHGKFLTAMTGMTERQIRRAILSQVAYQGMSRGVLRDPESDKQMLVIVPDEDTSDDLASYYPGCEEQLLTNEPVIRTAQRRTRQSTRPRHNGQMRGANKRDWPYNDTAKKPESWIRWNLSMMLATIPLYTKGLYCLHVLGRSAPKNQSASGQIIAFDRSQMAYLSRSNATRTSGLFGWASRPTGRVASAATAGSVGRAALSIDQ